MCLFGCMKEKKGMVWVFQEINSIAVISYIVKATSL